MILVSSMNFQHRSITINSGVEPIERHPGNLHGLQLRAAITAGSGRPLFTKEFVFILFIPRHQILSTIGMITREGPLTP